MKLKLVNETDELINDLVEQPETDSIDLSTDDSEIKFIDSDELNSIREILLDIPDDIMLLLLNDAVIIFATEIDNVSMVYTLPEDSDEFNLIKLPNHLSDILGNPDIIKYTPERIDPRHDKIMDILMSKLNTNTSDETGEEEPENE